MVAAKAMAHDSTDAQGTERQSSAVLIAPCEIRNAEICSSISFTAFDPKSRIALLGFARISLFKLHTRIETLGVITTTSRRRKTPFLIEHMTAVTSFFIFYL